MEHPLIKQEILDNGVTLRLYDASRKIAGDRWLVSLLARATVPVKDGLLSGAAVNPDDLETIKQALGNEVVFEQKRERFFVDDLEKHLVFKQLVQSLLSATKSYISHPEFPVRFVNKCVREYLTKKQLKDQMKNRR